MRLPLILALMIFGTLAVAQEAPVAPTKFGIKPLNDVYPQGKVTDVLASTIKAIEKDRIEYFVAHLLDPKFVEARINDRAKQLEVVVDKDLRALRDEQVQAGIPRRERLPAEPKEFALAVAEEAKNRAFKLVVRDIRAHLAENPESLREFKKFQRIGVVVDTGEVGTITLKDTKDVQLNFKKLETRWYIEDRKTAEVVGEKK
jgi:hypothetical protein